MDLSRLISLVLSAHSDRVCRVTAGEGVSKGAVGDGAADGGGGAGAGGGGGDDPPKAPEVIPVERHNADMARMRKESQAKAKALEEAQARLAEYDTKAKEAEEAKLTAEERINKRLKDIESKHATELAEARKIAEAEKSRRHDLLKRNALMNAVTKAGLYEPDLVVEILSQQVVVTDGDEVAQVTDGIHTSVDDVVKAFSKARPRFVPNPSQGGTGDKGGKSPRAGKKAPGELTGADLEAAVLEEVRGMTGHQQEQSYR
jgi:hypothetical protein